VGGLLPGSCIPPLPLQEVRDLARYRGKTVQAGAFEVRRPGTSRDSAGRMLGSAASGITGTGPTAMIEALVDGERRGAVLADRAGGRARTAGKLADLSMAREGRVHRAPRADGPADPGPRRGLRHGGGGPR
jgi:transposase